MRQARRRRRRRGRACLHRSGGRRRPPGPGGGLRGACAARPIRAGAASRLLPRPPAVWARAGWRAARSVTSRRWRPRQEAAPGRGIRATPAPRLSRRPRPPWRLAGGGRRPEGAAQRRAWARRRRARRWPAGVTT